MAVNTTSNNTNIIRQAINAKMYAGLEPQLYFAKLAMQEEHPNRDAASAGDAVQFRIDNLLNPNTDTLPESSDPSSVTMSTSIKTVTVLEKGNLVTTTKKLELTSIDGVRKSRVPFLVGQNAGESTDLYARSVLDTQVGSAYVTYVGQTAKANITSADKLTAAVVRATRLKLERKNVKPHSMFNAYIWVGHPDVLSELRAETAAGGWLDIAKYADPSSALAGEIGMFEGFRFISTTNARQEYAAGVLAQAATTVNGAHSAGATSLAVTLGTGLDAGDVIRITVGSDTYDYEVNARSTNTLTLGNCIQKNDVVYRTNTAGLITALSGGEAVAEGTVVYTNYAMGDQAFGYAYAEKPNYRETGPFDAMGRIMNATWYALHGFGELRPEALHKVYCGSANGNNS